MTTIEAAVWVLGCWFAAGVVAAWAWVRTCSFHPRLDKELRESERPLSLTGWRR